MITEHCRTARLPHGVAVAFVFSSMEGLAEEWWPATPSAESVRSEIFAAYEAERDAFMVDIATMVGASVTIADAYGFTTYEPEVRH